MGLNLLAKIPTLSGDIIDRIRGVSIGCNKLKEHFLKP